MIPKNRRPTHPGTILREMFLKPRNVSMTNLEKATGISRKHLSRIVNGHAKITPWVAIKLAAALETSPELWLNAQQSLDIFDARQELIDWEPLRTFDPKDTEHA